MPKEHRLSEIKGRKGRIGPVLAKPYAGYTLRQFATGCCNYPRTACIHHVLHVAFHFQSEVPYVQCSTIAMKKLLITIGQIRGDVRTGGYVDMQGSENTAITEWVENTPVLKKWVMSPQALVAPAGWPGDVHEMFALRLHGQVPSPYEVAGLRTSPTVSRGEWHSHEVSVLVAYACGMSLSIMEEGLDVDRKYILADMIKGAENLCKIPQFRLWTWNLDLSLVPMPPLEGHTLNQKLEIFQQLQNHPFKVDTNAAKALLNSPFFRSYAKLQLLPKHRSRRPPMGAPLVGPPRRKKNGQKENASQKVPSSK